LGGLPLALDQAGAYIEETGCSLADYQHRYQLHRADLLAERRGLIDDHPLPVATTWSLSFELVKVANPAAADLLRLCAFLAPDAIPEAIITKGAPHLGTLLAPVGADPYLLDQAIEALRAYSLLQRDTRSGADNLLSMHRLVQAVLKDQMDKQSRQQWAERTVHAVYAALPDVEHETWPQWERILVHAIVCTELIEQQGFHFAEAAHFLQQTGWYLTERARYSAAEPLLEQAYQMSEQEQGAEHLDTARDASTLAELYYAQGKFEQAEPLYVRALAIREQQLGPVHPDTAQSLNNLAALYQAQGKYEQAQPLYMRSLAIRERVLGPEHPDTASTLDNMANLYANQGKYELAEPLYMRSLAIRERVLGPLHPNTQITRRNYIALLRTMGRDAEAVALETKRMPPL
jgi:tetratricopeptide (TPR) repeat protein